MLIKEINDKTLWEGFLEKAREKTFLQSFNWGEFQKATGEKVWRFGIYEDGNLIALAQVIKVKAKRGTFLFLPHGPNIKNLKSKIKNHKQILNLKFKILNILLEELKKIAKKENCGFIRIAPIWQRKKENIKIFKDLGFREAPIHIHPEITWELDIKAPEEELLAQMRKTTRYLIKQGLKNQDLKIFQSTKIRDLEIFNQIYQATAKRQNFTPFSFQYLKNEFLAFLPENEIALFLAKYKDKFIAGAIIVFWQKRAFYHHGASLRFYPKVPASYLLQWEAIKEAKKRGCQIYNFWGIANTNSKIQKHPWRGLTLFKQGFGGYKMEYLKTQDFIISQKYWFNFFIEKLRKLKRGY